MKRLPGGQSPLAQNILTAALLFVVILALYITTNRLTGMRQGATLVTALDAAIPFVPAAIFGYFLAVPVFLFPFFILLDRLLIRRISWGIILCTIVVLAVFFIFPTRVPRPGIPTQENFLYWLMAFLYVMDNPVNCLPGLVLTITVFITFCMWSLARFAGWAGIAALALIMISSLFLRQHLLADCLASVVVGYGVFRFFARPAIRNAQSAGLNISTGDWQSLALRFGYSYFAPIAAGLLLFEIGLRFNPVLPTN